MPTQPSLGPLSTNAYSAGLDMRSRYGKEYKRTFYGLSDALGGHANLQPWQRILVERTAELTVRARMIFDRSIQEDGDLSIEADRRFKWFNGLIRQNLITLGFRADTGTGRPRKKVNPATTDPATPAPKPTPSLEDLMRQNRRKDDGSRPI